MHKTTYRCEVLVRAKWSVASRGWSAVERDSWASKNMGRTDVRFVAEVRA